MNPSASYAAVGAMKTAISPSPSQASLNNAIVNPFSKSETDGGKRSSVSPARSPMTKKKGPIVKTVQKKSNADDNTETDQKNEETKGKGTKRTSLMKRNETYTKKNLEESVKKQEPQKAGAMFNRKERLNLDNGVEKKKKSVKSPLVRRNNVAKISPANIDKGGVDEGCTGFLETKKQGKTKSPSVSSEQSTSSKKNKTFDKERVEPTKLQKTNKPVKKVQDKPSPASKEKMEVKGKKMKTPKMPPPLSDKEKFDLLFEAYSKWGSDDGAADKAISAYQLTRWLKNVELLEGKKVSIKN